MGHDAMRQWMGEPARRATARERIVLCLTRDMGTHMKTTIDIADSVLTAARKLAASEGTTLRALVEAGLRQAVADRGKHVAPFRLRRASYRGRGLRPEVKDRSWEQVREMAYDRDGA